MMFKGQGTVDTRVICPLDVQTMFVRQARMAHWRKVGGQTRVKGGVWLDPIQAMLRRNYDEE